MCSSPEAAFFTCPLLKVNKNCFTINPFPIYHPYFQAIKAPPSLTGSRLIIVGLLRPEDYIKAEKYAIFKDRFNN
jgi:hypothetical protein